MLKKIFSSVAKKKIIDFFKLDKQTIFIIIFILFFKSFAYNPSIVPSGSMIPTIDTKSLILVNVHSYGLRIPLTKIKFFENKLPERGDIAVFRFPLDESTNYIKRIVAIPGDEIYYNENEYMVNVEPKNIIDFQYMVVPPDKYFAIGDNILQSNDSRYWGFVPKENLIGEYVTTIITLGQIKSIFK